MKIALIAAYNNNYGSLLQVYATQSVLNELGFDSKIIVYKKRNFVNQMMRCFNFPLVKMKFDDVYKRTYTKLFYSDIYNQLNKRNSFFESFRKKNLKFDNEVKSVEALERCLRSYDMVLLGSDQVWNPINYGTHFYTMELVPDDMFKATYAPSFGVSRIPWYQKKKTENYLNRINNISVREKTGARIIKELINRDVKVVCDPTVLLTREKWEQVESKRLIKEDYLFCYFLGDNESQRKLAKDFAQKKNLKIVALQHLDKFIGSDIGFADYSLYNIDPFDFISLVANSNFVMTDSFHGTIFSIIFEKLFFSFPRYSYKETGATNSRIDDILGRLGLSSRKLTGKENIEQIISRSGDVIDFNTVQNELNNFRNESMEYLTNVLNEGKNF